MNHKPRAETPVLSQLGLNGMTLGRLVDLSWQLKVDSSDIINSVQYVFIIHWLNFVLNKVEAFIECESPWVLDVLGSLHSFSVPKNVGL